jgi:hypothetical protein
MSMYSKNYYLKILENWNLKLDNKLPMEKIRTMSAMDLARYKLKLEVCMKLARMDLIKGYHDVFVKMVMDNMG